MTRRSERRDVGVAMQHVASLVGALVSQLPGLAFFLNWAPPMFPAITLLTGGVGLAVFAAGYRGRRARMSTRAAGFVVGALACAAIYSVLLGEWSVAAPAERSVGQRYQIGFGVMSFSLTDDARTKGTRLALRTPEDYMLAFGGYEPHATALIWREWTIIAAGSLLIALYVVAYLGWCYGLAILAKSFSADVARSPSQEK